VTDAGTKLKFKYRADLEIGAPLETSQRAGSETGAPFVACECGSLDEWLMERYTAFNRVDGQRKFFRIWHPPWPQRVAEAELSDVALLEQYWPWFGDAQLAGANFSPGLRGVWMGRPHRIQ
jgi:uncharacterized protein YqjF (DUF2071 family)